MLITIRVQRDKVDTAEFDLMNRLLARRILIKVPDHLISRIFYIMLQLKRRR